jgi:DNA-binding transcriptional LysR family regulator
MSDLQRSVSETATVDVGDVRAFGAVVDLGSVTAAAHALGETKGSVSRRLSRLEAAVGLPLLVRSGRRVVPTEDGVLYRKAAGRALDLLADARDMLHDQHGTPVGHLRVTAPIGLGTVVLGPLLAPFIEAYPGITLELVLTDAVLSFERDRIDVALRLSSGLPDSELVAHRLFAIAGTLVASPGYLARRGAPTHPRELHEHQLLLPPIRGQGTPLRLEHQVSGAVFEAVFRGHVTCHDLLLLREAARGGAGIAMMPDRLGNEPGLTPVLADWTFAGGIGLGLETAGGPLPPKVRVFRDFVRENLRCPEG